MKIGLSVTTSASYDDTVRRLVDDEVAGKLAARDATLWGPAAEPEAAIRLSWVGLPVSSRPLLGEIDALRAELWSEGVDQVVLCGMGGSSLAPEVIAATYGVPLTIVDSTHPGVVQRATGGDLSRTVVVVSSKSGGTLETDSQRRAFIEAFAAAGIDAASRLVVVTDPGSDLEALARNEGYRKVFLADPHVGGRYSALTAFGLVPTGLAGIDVAELLDEADAVMAKLASDAADNPALLLAAALAATDGRDKVAVVDLGSGIPSFPDWAEQLIAESTGKEGRGVLPLAVEGPTAPEVQSPLHDVVVAALVPADDAGQRPDGVGEPWVSVSGTLGAQFLTWETATAVVGRLLGTNPFDQPDVESAKKAARGLLDTQHEDDVAQITDDGVEVRGSDGLLDGVDTLPGAVEALLSKLGDDGYLAVMAYLDAVRDGALHGVREALARRTGRPTTFGWGPRFLHSTGQYHKGGPPQGVFLQITSSEASDAEIPDQAFTFGTLIAAQAAGDAGVLAEHDRPVLRLHLLDPTSGVKRLIELLR
ncbi:MAG: glucose-6-phosphate isomerase [Propionibacteriales bacterium]|nr:glucose-6-phosphate isomerase [Propionibacteriales bacterium]